jgi:signal transduction histidine kinase
VLLNLLGNALKYTESGYIRILIQPICSLIDNEQNVGESFKNFKAIRSPILRESPKHSRGTKKNPSGGSQKKSFDIKSGETIGVCITVSDSGCGMSQQEIDKLFRLFGKLEGTDITKLNQTGIGLGLAISQSLVRLLNGNRKDEEIKVVSRPGVGSEFSFNLYSMEKRTDDESKIAQRSVASNNNISKKNLYFFALVKYCSNFVV